MEPNIITHDSQDFWEILIIIILFLFIEEKKNGSTKHIHNTYTE